MIDEERIMRIKERRASTFGAGNLSSDSADYSIDENRLDNIRKMREERVKAVLEQQQSAQKKTEKSENTKPLSPAEDPKNASWWEKTKAFVKKYPSPFSYIKNAPPEDLVAGTIRELPKGTVEVAKTIPQDVTRFGISAMETPGALKTGEATGKYYDTPFGKLGSYQTEAQARVERGDPLWKAIGNPAIETIFAAGDAGTIAKVFTGSMKSSGIKALSNLAHDLDTPVKGKDFVKAVKFDVDGWKSLDEIEEYIINKNKSLGNNPLMIDNVKKEARRLAGLSEAKVFEKEIPKYGFEYKSGLMKSLNKPGLTIEDVSKKPLQEGKDIIEQQNKRLQIIDQLKKEKVSVDIPPERVAKIEKIYPNADTDFKVKANTAINVVKENPNVRDDMKKWLRSSYRGKAEAQKEALGFKINENPDNLLKHEAGEVYEGREMVENKFDELFKKAEEAGIKIEKRKNYIPHVYNESPEEIQKAVSKAMKDKGVPENIIQEYLDGKELPADMAKTLRMNPFFTQERAFESYAKAAEYGLTPKYKNMSQLVGHYVEKLNDVVANQTLVDDMIKSGTLSATGGGGKMAVNLPGSEGMYFAKPKIAGYLNDYFRNEDALNVLQLGAKYGSKFSKGLQNIVLAGGLPGTNLNFFTFGHVVKSLTTGVGDLATGNLKGALTNFKSLANVVRSNFTGQSIKWFNSRVESGIMGKIANEGIDMTKVVGSYKETNRGFKNFFKNTKAKKLIGESYDKVLQEKTFNSFLPMQTVTVFEDTYKSALKKGLPEAEASKLAGDTTKNFMGLFDRLRGKTADEALSTVAFAPQFREGLIHTYWNTLKSLSPTTWSNPAFKENRRLAIGMGITFFGGYDLLNKKLTGHHMWENPEGKKTELMIPGKDGKVYFVPFMPSQLAFFRNAVESGVALAEGDEKTAVQKAGSNLSMGLKLVSDVVSNEDYFGNEIYDNQAPRSEKYAAIAKYIGLNANHPYVKGAWQQMINQNAEKQPIYPTYERITKLINEGEREKAQKEIDLLSKEDKLAYEEIKKQKIKPLGQVMSEMMEVPLRFSSEGKIKSQEYYKKIDEISRDIKSLPEAERTDKIQDYMNETPEKERRGLLYALGKADIDTEGVSISEDIIRIKPTYNKVKELYEAGDTEGAKQVLRGLNKDDKEAFKKIMASVKAKKTKQSKLEMESTVEEVKTLISQGKRNEAKQLLASLTTEEKRIFKLTKESMGY